jgi:hypothetical protein
LIDALCSWSRGRGAYQKKRPHLRRSPVLLMPQGEPAEFRPVGRLSLD